jgi:hypothetical protein
MTQAERDEALLKMLVRMKRSKNGPEFMEWMKDLSAINYKMFKKSGPDANEYCKGYAVAIDSIVESMENAARKLAALETSKQSALPTDEGGIQINPCD